MRKKQTFIYSPFHWRLKYEILLSARENDDKKNKVKTMQSETITCVRRCRQCQCILSQPKKNHWKILSSTVPCMYSVNHIAQMHRNANGPFSAWFPHVTKPYVFPGYTYLLRSTLALTLNDHHHQQRHQQWQRWWWWWWWNRLPVTIFSNAFTHLKFAEKRRRNMNKYVLSINIAM